MKYVRAILSFSLISLFLKDIWHTLLLTLGIGTTIYGHEQQEKAIIENQQKRQEERWKSQYDRQRYNEWLRRHR